MKKLLIMTAFLSLMLMVPVMADEAAPATGSVYSSTESVRSFSRPYDSRFQYSLPEHGAFKFRSGKSAAQTTKQDTDDDVVELDTADIKPAKKVIKRMSSDSESKQNTFDNSNMPMNYENFPKYYDPNDMSTQQFMPTLGF